MESRASPYLHDFKILHIFPLCFDQLSNDVIPGGFPSVSWLS